MSVVGKKQFKTTGTGGTLAELIKKFTRRLISYLHQCSPSKRIEVADFLLQKAKDDDENKNLLEVPEKLRKMYKQ